MSERLGYLPSCQISPVYSVDGLLRGIMIRDVEELLSRVRVGVTFPEQLSHNDPYALNKSRQHQSSDTGDI